MSTFQWKYVKPLKDKNVVKEFLKRYNVRLDEEIIKCITENNGGRPRPNIFNTDKSKERVFKSLLSYNAEDEENIYYVYPSLFQNTTLYPLGTDAAGNFICVNLKNNTLVLWNHENNGVEVINIK